jgi:serine/threonine-protein kinase
VSDLPEFEPYLTLRLLERGPSYELFLARHPSLPRQVWIKALRPEVPLSSSVARRLEREAEILALLDHAGIIAIHECVKRAPRLWLVLEAVEGWSLAEVLRAARSPAAPPDVTGAVALALGTARALEHAHRAGVIHGALEPQHVLVSERGLVKLTGFSLALLGDGLERDSVDTEPGLSEAGYLSPEQALGERADARSDLFSLGVVLYELLTGRHPFHGSGERVTAHEIRHLESPALRDANPEISPELERIVQRCLEKAPERRFSGAGQLARALEQVLGNEALAELDTLVLQALTRRGLPAASAARARPAAADRAEQRRARRGLRHALIGLIATSALLLVGGALLSHWLEVQHPATPPPSRQWTSATGGELLVVAEPWAYVYVDGEQLETTPFATPLRLAPGEHFVRLEHPNAPSESRRIELAPGQRVVLAVTMLVEPTASDAGAGSFEQDAGAR